MIQVKRMYAHNSLRNFSYVVYDRESGSAWVIDPFDPEPLIEYIKKHGLQLQGILNTHQHWDHIQGNQALLSRLGGQVIKLPGESTLDLDQGNGLRMIDAPGHTPDHQVFQWIRKGKSAGLFSGDTIFNSGVGNCKSGGDPGMLYDSVVTLRALPTETVVYPGHDYVKRNLEFALSVEPENRAIQEALLKLEHFDSTNGMNWTLGDERRVNPFFRTDSPEIRQNLQKKLGLVADADERAVFLGLRKLRDQW